MSKKKEIAYEYSKRVSRGNLMTKDLAECAFIVGWDACLKHLGEIPWDEAMNEIANHLEINRSEKLNDYQNASYVSSNVIRLVWVLRKMF